MDKKLTYYQKEIKKAVPMYDPRHIEAYMRLEQETGCLDHLSKDEFSAEIESAILCISKQPFGLDAAERLAQSMGL